MGDCTDMPEAEKKENRPSLLEGVTPGERLRLRDGAMAHVRKREWVFKGIEKDGALLLMHESESYGLVVKENDIDWEAYRKVSPTIAFPRRNEG
jgi:hypothetical protein